MLPSPGRFRCDFFESGRRLLSAGVSILVVSRRLGHAKVSMTLDTDPHTVGNDAQKAADVMAGVLAPTPR